MSKVTSDGSTASYYELPEGAKELQHLISYRNMNGQLAEIFRACYRYGIVSHSDQLRDAKKMMFYAMAEVERLEKWAVLAAGGVDDFQPGRDYPQCRCVTEAIHAEPSTEDMTDPRNWRAGDWVECVKDIGTGAFVCGNLYRVRETETEFGSLGLQLDEHGSTTNGVQHKYFRFHARPDAEGWIKWEGGECPVPKGTHVDVRHRDGDVFLNQRAEASDYAEDWTQEDHNGDIIAYRPHLATKQGKG